MKSLIQNILSSFARNEGLVLATVISHRGSTPRDTGARCLIYRDGTLFDTIGGGLVESKVIEKAKTVFKEECSAFIEFDMAKQFLGAESMICGGEMEILVEYLAPSPENINFFHTFKQFCARRESCLLMVDPSPSEKTRQTSRRIISLETEKIAGPTLDSQILKEIKKNTPVKAGSYTFDQQTFWIEPIRYPKKCFLFGAGHIARATAPLLASTGFQTTVVDDRKELLSTQYFGTDVSLVHVDQFENCFLDLEIDAQSFVVIMTRGHSLDKSVLSQAINSEAGYIGMIGSRRKRNTIYQVLREEGVTQQVLDNIHSPVGLDIGADTPAEIGISIAAELIKVRSTA